MGQGVTQATIVSQAAVNAHQNVEQIAFFDGSGNPVSPQTVAPTGATVPLTGYAAHAAGAVAAADSANVAIAKLEARIAALESA